jgi:hypothetical protein
VPVLGPHHYQILTLESHWSLLQGGVWSSCEELSSEEVSRSESLSGIGSVRLNHRVKGCCRGHLVRGGGAETAVWDGLVALTREVRQSKGSSPEAPHALGLLCLSLFINTGKDGYLMTALDPCPEAPFSYLDAEVLL